MSLILEALRKSEAERRRGSAPDVALELPPVPARGRRAAPAWLWPLLAAIALLLVLAWWPGSRPAAEATASDTDADTQATASAEPAPGATPAPLPAAPAAVPRRREPPAVAAMPTAAPSQPAAHASVVATAPMSASRSAPEPRPEPPPGDDTPDIRATTLPPVTLNMHMWDPAPARRFVILGGRRMAEGDSLGGLQVVAIERDGVVVERDGQRANVRL